MTDQSERLKQLRAHMDQHGLKTSRQRDIIVDIFFAAPGHLTVDELLAQARTVDANISQATVYRTVRLLTDCGLAQPRQFQAGQTRYEPSDRDGEHHDHLICTRCGVIVEFVHARIERLQEVVAAEHGFVVHHHRMELYGLCAKCKAM